MEVEGWGGGAPFAPFAQKECRLLGEDGEMEN